MSRRSHVVLLISVCVLLAWGWFVTAPPTPTTGNATAPSTGNATAPRTGNATVSTGNATVSMTGSVTAPAPGSVAPPSALDWLVKIFEALQKLISGVLHEIGWAIVALVALFVFRDQLVKLLQGVTTAMEDRAVTLDVATVKVNVAERLNDIPDERPTWFSRSPLEIDDDTTADSTVFEEIVPQLEFPVTDYVAEQWSRRDNGARAAAMRQARGVLAAVSENAQTMAAVRSELLVFAERLETARFLEAEELVDLLGRHAWFGEALDQAEPKDLVLDHANLLILHCAGVAYAQMRNWDRASALLDKIVWKEKTPFYLPAADTWLACKYHAYVTKALNSAPNADLDSAPGLFEDVTKLLGQGRQLLAAMGQHDWIGFPIAHSNIGYYKREAQKFIGMITSALGEHSNDSDRKARYLDEAIEMFRLCIEPIDGDDPSTLDYNNLADTYRQRGDRQRGDFEQAHVFIDRAFVPNEPPDPTFCSTLALILAKEAQPARALRALDLYGIDEARRDGGANAEQYVDNQIVAAKLTFSLGPPRSAAYAGLAARILEDARQFLHEEEEELEAKTVAKLRTEIDELLGFAYHQLHGFEMRAVEAFDRLGSPSGASASVPEWRRRLGRARALTRLARAQRRNFSSQVAAQHWKPAHAALVDAGAQIKPFGLESSVPLSRRVRHLQLRLDTAVALRVVAEEGFAEGERKTAVELLDQESPILVSLRTSLQGDREIRDRIGEKEVAACLGQVSVCEARRSFLQGRILVWSDPSFKDAELISKVEGSFDAARGVQSDLDCLIDLELGEMLLAAALAGKGDPRDLYRRTLIALERAARSAGPAMRGETVRTLADAYSRRGAILRKAKSSAKPA